MGYRGWRAYDREAEARRRSTLPRWRRTALVIEQLNRFNRSESELSPILGDDRAGQAAAVWA
jgi:hypothetical protein